MEDGLRLCTSNFTGSIAIANVNVSYLVRSRWRSNDARSLNILSLELSAHGLYLLQVPVGGLVGFFITRSGRIENPIRIAVALVAIQMAFSFPVAIMTAMEITGDFI